MEIFLLNIFCLTCVFAGAYIGGGLEHPVREERKRRLPISKNPTEKEGGRDLSDDIAEMLNYSLQSRYKEKNNDKTDS